MSRISSELVRISSRYNGLGNAQAHAIAVNNAGNVYVTGTSKVSGTNNEDYDTIKYSQNYDCSIIIEGDTNNDCKVDFVDLAEIASHWLECNLNPQEACWQ